ncbi:hypothetical protein [Hydrogenophaga sp. RWCD_12]|uniref:hypothetical protein n=1 Tax=Hydrogenophaga sp. RWCD_12 TaxID=3391190 RepID=UPI0039853CBF
MSMLFRVVVTFLMLLFCRTVLAQSEQKASVEGAGIAINANNGARVYLDASKKIYNLSSREDQRRILKLEEEKSAFLAEISRLSFGSEEKIIRRSRQEFVESLPAEIREKYLAGNSSAASEYLEKSIQELVKRSEKLNQAISKAEFELALTIADSNPTKAMGHLDSSLKLDPQNLPASALAVHLLTSMGRIEDVIELVKNLHDRNWLAAASKDSAEEVDSLVTASFVYAIGALIKSGRRDLAVETINRGLEFSAFAKARGYSEYSNLEQILKLQLNMMTENGRGKYLYDYESLKRSMSTVDYAFDDCKNCYLFISTVAGYNLALVPMAYLVGDTNTAKTAFDRAQQIIIRKDLPSTVWFNLRQLQLVSIARSNAINGDEAAQREYLSKAVAHLRSGLDSGVFSTEKNIDIAGLELESLSSLQIERGGADARAKLVGTSLAVSTAIERTKGYEFDHVDLLISLAREYSRFGHEKESEVFFRRAEETMAQLNSESGSTKYFESLGHLLSEKGYRQLRAGDYVNANETAVKWSAAVGKLSAMGVYVDASEPLELNARATFYLGGCEKSEPIVLSALRTVESQIAQGNDGLVPVLRKKRLLKLVLQCSAYDRSAWERYLEHFSYSDLIFEMRPWSPENVDDIIYSITGLIVSDLVVRQGGGLLYYSDLLRSRMMRCAGYKATVEKCSAYGAMALAFLGNSRIKEDPLLVETSLKEFQAIEKRGRMNRTSRELYLSALTLYAGALDWSRDRKKYIELQREVLRIYDLVPDSERTDMMKQWAENLRKWANSGPTSKFDESSWWFLGTVTFFK